ncbi:hypothetical protein [Archangium lipolyticum]|uniref:hypothetical protein n=1 Tax=Archangium lipolyticum TaxID=2970465 RepID=UPI00214A22E3|nr:hypothetical protein [Archangium lipolyticum]
MRRALLLGFVLLVSCNDLTPPDEVPVDGGIRGDGGMGDGGSTLQAAPMGGGFCCPIETPSCSCFRTGGWVATDDISKCDGICDGAPPYTRTVDSHGCEVVAIGGTNSCNPTPPPSP